MIDVNPNQLETVKRILAQHVPGCEVRAFGSRVSWTAKDYSDLDLAVVGERALEPDALRRLKEAFEESDLPFRVDVLDWHAIGSAFQKVIEKAYEVIQRGKAKCLTTGGGRVEVPFPEVVDYQEGPGIMAVDFRDTGIPLIRLAGLERGASILAGCNFLDPAMVEKRWSHFRVRKGDVLLSTSATLGRIAVVDDSGSGAIPYTGVIRMRPKDDRLWSSFIPYLLESPDFQQQVEAMGVGSVIRHFGPMHLRQMHVALPPLPEQRAIAHILGTLDDKIELNRRMNETLEAMARAIFRSWFVDFDPVRAKAEGRQPEGMDAETAALFPDGFEDSALGKIPRGWKAGRWGELITLQYGKGLSGYGNDRGPIPVYGTNGKIGTCAEPLCRHPGIVIGRKGAYRGVHFSDTPFFAIDTAFYVEPKQTLQQRWAYYEILGQDINGMDSGSAIPSTSRDDFYNLRVVIPDLRVQQQFVNLLNPHWDKQRHNAAQSDKLAAIRDALLPKLLSGEIRVGEAEAQIVM